MRFLRLFSLPLLIAAISGCSATKTPFAYNEIDNNQTALKEGEEAPPPRFKQAKATDTSKPASFEEYRQWRQAHDPNGQTYAEYTQWDAAYRQWLQQQKLKQQNSAAQ